MSTRGWTRRRFVGRTTLAVGAAAFAPLVPTEARVDGRQVSARAERGEGEPWGRLLFDVGEGEDRPEEIVLEMEPLDGRTNRVKVPLAPNGRPVVGVPYHPTSAGVAMWWEAAWADGWTACGEVVLR